MSSEDRQPIVINVSIPYASPQVADVSGVEDPLATCSCKSGFGSGTASATESANCACGQKAGAGGAT